MNNSTRFRSGLLAIPFQGCHKRVPLERANQPVAKRSFRNIFGQWRRPQDLSDGPQHLPPDGALWLNTPRGAMRLMGVHRSRREIKSESVVEHIVGWCSVPMIPQYDRCTHYIHGNEVQFASSDACFQQFLVALRSSCSSVVQYDSWELQSVVWEFQSSPWTGMLIFELDG